MRGIEVVTHGTGSAVVKRYPTEETRTFKCFGSGARNEALLPTELMSSAPRILRFESTETEDVVWLEALPGEQLSAPNLTEERARAAGKLLGQIHAHARDEYGSLDRRYVFVDAASAFRPRFEVALQLLHGTSSALATQLRSWAEPRIQDLRTQVLEARLVHGDFGLSNLIWGERPMIIDWEHARFGDPLEDWAKILLAQEFPEKNGMGTDAHILAAMARAWSGSSGLEADWLAPQMVLYKSYYAATLAVFLGNDNLLRWLDAVVS